MKTRRLHFIGSAQMACSRSRTVASSKARHGSLADWKVMFQKRHMFTKIWHQLGRNRRMCLRGHSAAARGAGRPLDMSRTSSPRRSLRAIWLSAVWRWTAASLHVGHIARCVTVHCFTPCPDLLGMPHKLCLLQRLPPLMDDLVNVQHGVWSDPSAHCITAAAAVGRNHTRDKCAVSYDVFYALLIWHHINRGAVTTKQVREAGKSRREAPVQFVCSSMCLRLVCSVPIPVSNTATCTPCPLYPSLQSASACILDEI